MFGINFDTNITIINPTANEIKKQSILISKFANSFITSFFSDKSLIFLIFISDDLITRYVNKVVRISIISNIVVIGFILY